jgi:hypothetical protein
VILSISLLGKKLDRTSTRHEKNKQRGDTGERANKTIGTRMIPLRKAGSAREFLQATWFKKYAS